MAEKSFLTAQGLVLGTNLILPTDNGVGHARVQGLLASRPARTQHVETHACNDRRQRSPRFSTSLVSVRLNRSQASWTASSASLTDPSIRYATARR
jgi:hypothetical protein